jgi:Type I phosphodiesterase / nucleotide pyrophosphatase
MKNSLFFGASTTALAFAAMAACPAASAAALDHHVLLISIDGLHALDFANCSGQSGGAITCPNLAALAKTGLVYTQASTSKPSDSFPGLTALATGGTPKSTGAFYDVSYDRALSPPAKTTPYGIPGGPNLCPRVVGTQVGFDEEIDFNYRRLDAGGGINTAYLPRDPANGCAPVYPHNFIKVNTVFEVVHDAGGYTAWSDKHPSYELVKGMSGTGVDDFYAPEINSIPVPLPQVASMQCSPLPDQTAVSSSNSWTDSFQNIKCYDSLKVQAIINEIDGLDHTGTVRTRVPNVFGMNFQAVSVGEKLVESSISTTGGYKDAFGTPSAALAAEIRFVDNAIGSMVTELKARNLFDATTIIITAKHGQSPIDPNRVLRIPADDPAKEPPSEVLATVNPPLQALEDDVSLLWLSNRTPSGISSALSTLEAKAGKIGANGGEFYVGPSLALMYNITDSRTPDIIVAPNVGVIYTKHKAKIAEHGGFAHDDTNVMMLVSNPKYAARSINAMVQTAQVPPTILRILDLDPHALIAVRNEGTAVLPGF